MYVRIEVYKTKKGTGTKFKRGWDGALYIESDVMKPGVRNYIVSDSGASQLDPMPGPGCQITLMVPAVHLSEQVADELRKNNAA